MEYNREKERKLGLFWERKFAEIIIPYGFSAQETTARGIDRMVWYTTGEVVHVQIRHKNPFKWADYGECYGYERYRLDKDMNIVMRGGIALYVIHNYTRYGAYSTVNKIEDWQAQYIEYLATNIDLERDGPTWFGDYKEKQIMPICYWTIDKFEPLEDILIKLPIKGGDDD